MGMGFIFPMFGNMDEFWARMGSEMNNGTNLTVQTTTAIVWHTFTEKPLIGDGPTTVERTVTVTQMVKTLLTVTEVPLQAIVPTVIASACSAHAFSNATAVHTAPTTSMRGPLFTTAPFFNTSAVNPLGQPTGLNCTRSFNHTLSINWTSALRTTLYTLRKSSDSLADSR